MKAPPYIHHTIKNNNMNFQITTLAETMSASGFIIELNERKRDYNVKDMYMEGVQQFVLQNVCLQRNFPYLSTRWIN